MKYLDKSFSSRPASKEYRDNWERVFSSKSPGAIRSLINGDWNLTPKKQRKAKKR